MEKLTDELLHTIEESDHLDQVIAELPHSSQSLSGYLNELLEQKGLKRSRVIRMANLNDTYGYQIFVGQRSAGRNKVLQIAFAMALNLAETNRLLTLAKQSILYPKITRDAIIIFSIQHSYSLQKVNEELYRFGEETIC